MIIVFFYMSETPKAQQNYATVPTSPSATSMNDSRSSIADETIRVSCITQTEIEESDYSRLSIHWLQNLKQSKLLNDENDIAILSNLY
jgi:hypothetical protein